MTNYLAQGTLFYCTAMTKLLLLLVCFSTGRPIYLLLIVFVFGLSVYMSYLIIEENPHIISMGKWLEEKIGKYQDAVSSTVNTIKSTVT